MGYPSNYAFVFIDVFQFHRVTEQIIDRIQVQKGANFL